MTANSIAYLLLAAAGLLGVAIVRLRRQQRALGRLLTARQREHRAVMEFLAHAGEKIRSTFALDDTLETILEFVVGATRAQAGAVYLRDEEDPTFLRASAIQGLFPPLHPVPDKVFSRKQYLEEKLKKEKIRVGEGLVGSVAGEMSPLLIGDARRDPRVPPSANQVVQVDTLMAAPLMARNEVLGVIVLINRLADAKEFSHEDLSLLGALADQAAIHVNLVRVYRQLGEKQRLEQELRVAHEFQRMLIPRTAPRVQGLDIAGFSEAAQDVGGDYYDYFDVDEDHLGIAIADVAGKGIPGALVMATVRSTLRAEARGDRSPRNVLLRVNRHLVADTSPTVFVTMTYAILNRQTLRIRFARAGHEPTILCSPDAEDRPRLYTPNGIALGLVLDDTFAVTEEKEFELHERETAVFYTDGVVEAMNRAGEEYGAERFLETLRTHSRASAPEIIEAVTQDIRKFTRGFDQHDDLTLVVIKATNRAEEEARESQVRVEGAG